MSKATQADKTNRRSYARSSSFFMAMLFTILCGAVALSLGYFINYFAKGHFVHSAQTVIDSEVRYINVLDDLPAPQEGRLYVPFEPNGALPQEFPRPSQVLTEGLLIFDVALADQNKRYAARVHTLADQRKVLVGVDITQMAADYYFMQWIGIASIAFVMIVVFVSYIISIFVVNGTNKIASTAQDIIRTGDLSQRVDMNSRWDDLSNVANVLNSLLDRIENLMRGVRQVSDNIAHDLRTPLTRMRSRIEALQKHNPAQEDYIQLLAEADHLLQTFNALLRISRIETEQQRSQFASLNLGDIVRDVIDFYAPLAEEKSIVITVDLIDAPLHGDKDLLFQAFANIMDNAVKYTPEGGTVQVRLDQKDKRITLSVENSGMPIDEEDLPKIFDRFYRTDKSRHQPGTGLGLSLVSVAIQLHNGLVSVHNTKSGVELRAVLNLDRDL